MENQTYSEHFFVNIRIFDIFFHKNQDFQNSENAHYPLPMKSDLQINYKGGLVSRLPTTLISSSHRLDCQGRLPHYPWIAGAPHS